MSTREFDLRRMHIRYPPRRRSVELLWFNVFMLNSSFGKIKLLRLAAEVDAGFDPQVLADMFDMLARYTDRDLSVGSVDPAAVRRFFADWADEIRDPVR